MANGAHAGRAAGHIMYALYAISLFTAFPMVIGVIVAYLSRSDAQIAYQTHLLYGIRAFWISLLGVIIAFVLSAITLGLLAWLFFGIVWIYVAWKTVRGWMRLIDARPAPGFE